MDAAHRIAGRVTVGVTLALLLAACNGGDDPVVTAPTTVAVDDTATPQAAATKSPSPTLATPTDPATDPGGLATDAPDPDGLPPIQQPTSTPNAAPDTEEPTGSGQAGWVSDVRVSTVEGYDRIVIVLAEPEIDGVAGWTAEYVEEYVPIGEDVHPDPPGDGTLQLTLRNVALPFDDLGAAFPTGVIPGPGSAITQVDVVGWFEGQQDFVIGTATEGPFRVYSDHPRRIVVEVAHA